MHFPYVRKSLSLRVDQHSHLHRKIHNHLLLHCYPCPIPHLVLPLYVSYTLPIPLIVFTENLPYRDSEHSAFQTHIHFPSLKSFQRICPSLRPCVAFCNKLVFMVSSYSLAQSPNWRTDKEVKWRWEDSIRMDLREIGWGGVNWIHLAQDRDQWQTCKHGNESSSSIKGREFLTSWVTVSFSRSTVLHEVSYQWGFTASLKPLWSEWQ